MTKTRYKFSIMIIWVFLTGLTTQPNQIDPTGTYDLDDEIIE